MLVAQAVDDGGLSGWILGLGIGALVVAIVVLVLAAIIDAASRIERQARSAVEALEVIQAHTAPLWEVRTVNQTLDTIIVQATAARRSLEGAR